MQWPVLVVLCWACWCAMAVPAPRCTPGAMDEDARMARVCGALDTILNLYAEASDKGVPNGELQYLDQENPDLFNIARKRQELIHKFLRFGRRR